MTEAKIGHWCQGVAWSKDSKTVLAQCMVENAIETFTFDGKTLTKGTPIALKASPRHPHRRTIEATRESPLPSVAGFLVADA